MLRVIIFFRQVLWNLDVWQNCLHGLMKKPCKQILPIESQPLRSNGLHQHANVELHGNGYPFPVVNTGASSRGQA